MDALNQKIDELNVECRKIDLLKKFEEKTGVKSIHGVLGGACIITGFVFIGVFAQMLANFAGCIYPLYKSIKSLQSPQVNDDKQWLTYWTVYGLFMIFDDMSWFITSYLPSYYLIKMIFLIWLYAPTTNGAVLLYNTVVKDLFAQYSRKIDKFLVQLFGESKQLAEEIKEKSTDRRTLNKIDDTIRPRSTSARDENIAGEGSHSEPAVGSLSKEDPQVVPNKKED
ncbi:unnamed protein product [Moneuplotes crassus]|uniref:Receptor expression-enhancing protein n=1 Tax=Euplotes crassus TaxID=5936 RepID=A0AAD1XWB7_EUPCR|nr:unnamed protein product [Moneuplotes crassus]